MRQENTVQAENETSNPNEDLTLNEIKAQDVKGGVGLVFSFAQGGLKGAISPDDPKR